MPALPSFLPRFYRPSSRSGPHEHHPFSFKDVARSYGPDWALAVCLWFFLGWLNHVEGYKREFSVEHDISIQHTFAVHERVPPRLLLLISFVLPLVSVLLLSALVMRNAWDVHNSCLSILMSYTVAGLVTQVIKITVGRPRPDLIDRCEPAPGTHDVIPGLSNVSVCTSTNLLRLNDGFKSFPSGHSSLSFAGLTVLSLYLAGKLHLFSTRGHKSRAWLALTPLLGAVLVAVSRTMDNRHHWQDVLVGSVLGMLVAGVTYRGYYPPLSHAHADLPYAPREVVEGEDVEDGYERVHGEGESVVVRPSSEE